MMQKYLLPALALIGALFGLYVTFWSQKVLPTPPIFFMPPVSPYTYSIAGAGIIEASSQNRAIGTPFNEVVTRVFVAEGDYVRLGDPLFQLDIRSLEAQAAAAEADLQAAIVLMEDKKIQYSFFERLHDTRAVSEQIYEQAHFAFLEAQENVRVAQANLDVIRVNIARSTVRAPVEGQILQANIQEGEFAPTNPFFASNSTSRAVSQGSLMLMGTIQPLQVRVDIDEDDSWRYKAGSKATAFVRGNSHIHFPLNFVRIDPYVIPKSSFTGATSERVDTRVLQVIYEFERGDLPVYAGQILDIFIEAEPLPTFAEK